MKWRLVLDSGRDQSSPLSLGYFFAQRSLNSWVSREGAGRGLVAHRPDRVPQIHPSQVPRSHVCQYCSHKQAGRCARRRRAQSVPGELQKFASDAETPSLQTASVTCIGRWGEGGNLELCKLKDEIGVLQPHRISHWEHLRREHHAGVTETMEPAASLRASIPMGSARCWRTRLEPQRVTRAVHGEAPPANA